MKKYYITLLLSVSLFNFCISQTKYNDKGCIQKYYQFDRNFNKQQAIDFYLKNNGFDADNSFVSSKETTDASA